MANRFEEVLKYIVKVSGDEGLRTLAQEILEVGTASEESEQQVAGLVDELATTERAQKTIQTYRDLRGELEETRSKLVDARAGAAALFKEFKDGDASSKAITRAMRDARKAISDLEAAERSQQLQLQGLRGDLRGAGVDFRTLGSAQATLATRSKAAADGLRTLAAQTKAARAEQERLALRSRDADEAFRRQATASRTAAEALRQYRDRARETAQAQRDVGTATSGTVGILSRLRGVVAGLGAFLSIRAAIDGAKNILSLGDAAERTRRQLAGLFGSRESGDRAFAQLQRIARDNAQSFDLVLESAKRLKAFGLDPLDGTLQALIDQNARLGGSEEALSGTILAVGQAWAKQRLQGEEILQLVERGVPVWDLLAKATGKNTIELQKLSEQGKLGRDVIRALLDEIGKASEGAAGANVNSLSGLIAGLQDRIQRFFRLVADSGALRFFGDQIKAISARIDELAASGQLAKFAKTTSDALIAVSKAIAAGAKFLVEYSGAIARVGAAYAALKFTSILASLANLASGWAAVGRNTAIAAGEAIAATGRFGRLRDVIRGIPTGVKFVIAAIGIEAVAAGIKRLAEVTLGYDAAQRKATEAEKRAADQKAKLAAEIDRVAAANEKATRGALRSAEEIHALNDAEAAAYLRRLERMRAFYNAMTIAAREADDQAGLEKASAHLAQVELAIELVRRGLDATGDAFAKVFGKVNELTDKAIQRFDDLRARGESFAKAVDGLFDGLDLTSVDGLRQAEQILTAIGRMGPEAGAAIRTELQETLRKLTTDDLPKLREAAKGAFAGATEGAKLFRAEIARLGLKELGVDVAEIKTGFTEVGKAAIEAFRNTVDGIEELGLTAKQEAAAIGDAFRSALSKVETKAEIDALRTALQDAFKAGRISAAEFGIGAGELSVKLASLGKEGSAAISSIGNASEAAAKTMIASLERARADVAAKAQAIAAELGRALQAGASADVVGPLRAQYAALDGEIAALNTKIAEQQAAFQSAGQAGVKAASDVADGMKAAREEADAAGDSGKEVGEKTAEGAKGARFAISGVVGALVAMNERFLQVSEGARLAFVETYNGIVKGARSLSDVELAITKAADLIDQRIAEQRRLVHGLTAGYSELADASGAAFGNASVLAGSSAEEMRLFADAIREGRTAFNLLGEADLDALAASIERAADRARDLQEAAADAARELAGINRALQDEADRAAGNDEAIARRAHEDKIRRIEELAATAGAAGAAEATEARRRADEALARELDAIRQKREAERRAHDERMGEFDEERAAREGAAAGLGAVTPGAQVPNRGGPPTQPLAPVVNMYLDHATLIGDPTEKTLEVLARPLGQKLRDLAYLRR